MVLCYRVRFGFLVVSALLRVGGAFYLHISYFLFNFAKCNLNKKSMAANKGEDKLNELFDEIITEIAENGSSLIGAVKPRMSTQTFYRLLEDKERSKRYARATEMRADKMAEEILQISDNIGGDMVVMPDGREVVDHAVVQRDRLRVDARKWILAKMNPKKYGDKIDMTSGDEPLPASVKVTYINKVDGDSGK